jgi:hypothetical protein
MLNFLEEHKTDDHHRGSNDKLNYSTLILVSAKAHVQPFPHLDKLKNMIIFLINHEINYVFP